ncbi:hypothetical protein K7X08_002897 [Anisodus acutangulus]|uniref:Uncharacterized protein n=1 Tax=Anisodus acutangulus TaxID=402998 RepID=A0A9Q1MCL8_9SOLA|nr:hypothetical protein K7X08_002897 [Anisodus acutangulus]
MVDSNPIVASTGEQELGSFVKWDGILKQVVLIVCVVVATVSTIHWGHMIVLRLNLEGWMQISISIMPMEHGRIALQHLGLVDKKYSVNIIDCCAHNSTNEDNYHRNNSPSKWKDLQLPFEIVFQERLHGSSGIS